MTSNQSPLSQIEIAGAVRITVLAGLGSLALAAIKIATGIAGSSYALIADGIESLADVISSFAVLLGLVYAVKLPDEEHPYGHGKVETFAGLFVAFALLAAATLIAWQSLQEIRVPHKTPEWFTLPVLFLVIVVKLAVSRIVRKTGEWHGSGAMQADAWHHASDAFTSAAAFIGISIALFGGDEWAGADDWAALLACGIIVWNALGLIRQGTNELLDAAVDADILEKLRAIAGSVAGVEDVEKTRVRKSGLTYLMDIHIEVDRNLTVEKGHDIATEVKAALIGSPFRVTDVTVHVEPHGGFSPKVVAKK